MLLLVVAGMTSLGAGLALRRSGVETRGLAATLGEVFELVGTVTLFAPGLATVALAQRGGPVTPATEPRPRDDARHQSFLEVAKAGNIELLFVGDSITDLWRRGEPANGTGAVRGLAVWNEHFAPLNAANFGISGDTTQGVLWRLRNGEGEGFKPKAIMLMIGTNNTGGNSAPEIAMGVANVVFELRKDFPEAKILLLAIFPRSGPTSGVRAKINEINKLISALTDDRNVLFMDIGPKFLNAEGYIPRDVMSDGLHPTSKWYEIWAEAVHDKLVALMQ